MLKHLKKFVLSGVLLASVAGIMGTWYDYAPPMKYEPIYMTRTDLEKSVTYIAGARELTKTGKIYEKDSYIYINHPYKGIYVINNQNPADPKVEGFITAPGSFDIAIKGSVLYVDNAVDLVAFDLATKQVVGRVPNMLTPLTSPEAGSWGYYYGSLEKEGMVIVEWRKK